jgi:hypothetical protein
MTRGQSILLRPSKELDQSMVPETWLRFFNGPNAGYIDMEEAAKEMPWLIGATVFTPASDPTPHCKNCAPPDAQR